MVADESQGFVTLSSWRAHLCVGLPERLGGRFSMRIEDSNRQWLRGCERERSLLFEQKYGALESVESS